MGCLWRSRRKITVISRRQIQTLIYSSEINSIVNLQLNYHLNVGRFRTKIAKEFEFHSLLECDSFQTSMDIFTDFGRCCGATGLGCSTEPSSRDELVF